MAIIKFEELESSLKNKVTDLAKHNDCSVTDLSIRKIDLKSDKTRYIVKHNQSIIYSTDHARPS